MLMPDVLLDVRTMVPRERHPAIFSAFERLGSGEHIVLTADHDPVPLRRQFDMKHAQQFSWEYLERGPSAWRIRIGRAAAQ